MIVSQWVVRLGGIILFVVGLLLLLALVGLAVGVRVEAFWPWLDLVLGIGFIAGGVVLINGGTIQL